MKVTNNGTGSFALTLMGTRYHWNPSETKTLNNSLENELQAALDVLGIQGQVAITFDNASHTHANQTTLDAIQQAFTTALKSTYDGYAAGKENAGVAAGLIGTHESSFVHADIALNTAARHSHSNKTVLDAVEEAFTTALKSTYDGYAAGKENAGTAASVMTTHETTYNHVNFLSKNAVNGSFTSADGVPKTITVVDGQITAIV